MVMLKSILIMTLLATPIFSSATERLFGYSAGAEPLPKGAKELYLWVTSRTSKGQGTYQAYDISQEFEYGLTDRGHISLYLNQRYFNIQNSAPEDDDGNPLYNNREGFYFQGPQAAYVYNFISPYLNKHGFGFSLYLEPGYSRIFKINGKKMDEYYLETKLLFQKNFDNDTMFFVFNINVETEWRKFQDAEDSETELATELTTGLSKRVADGTFIGLEGRYHSEYPSMNFGNQEHYAYFLGPNIHYAQKRWWVTLTYLPQVGGWSTNPARKRGLHLSEHEEFEMRLISAVNF